MTINADDPGLLAAVDSGIADATSSPAPAPTPEPTNAPSADPVDTSSLAGSTPEADAGDDPVEGTGSGGGDDADGAGEGAGETVPADAGDAAAGDPDKPVGAPADAAAPAKVADPLNDPLPNALKRETKERITTLVSMVKDTSSKLEKIETEHKELLGYIQQTKATPEQYGQALDYLRMVNSSDPADKERLLQYMQGEVVALARMLGKPVPGVNFLEGHDDLIQKVGSGRLSPEDAQEIAAARERSSFETRRSQTQTAEQQRTAAYQQQIQTGKQQLNALEAQLKSVEPTVYAAKRVALIQTLKPVFAQIHPSQWAATFKRAYDALPAPVASPVTPSIPTARPGAPANGGGNTPLRAQNPAGAQRPEPKSVLDAINAGIADSRA